MHIPPEKKKEYLRYVQTNLYKLSQREMARRLGIGRTSVCKWAKDYFGYKKIKHKVNENFFDVWNEFSSYILGFIYADGNVAWNINKCYWSLTITSAAKDKCHLETMRRLLGSTKPLLYVHKTNSYRLIATNKTLCKKLMALGVMPKKSLVVNFPRFIPAEYLRHFIRGVIDADGTVRYFNRPVSPYFEIKIFSGSKLFCEGFIQALEKNFSISANLTKRKGANLYIVGYSCKRGKNLAKIIYSNSNLFLQRKYEQYLKCLKLEKGNKNNYSNKNKSFKRI